MATKASTAQKVPKDIELEINEFIEGYRGTIDRTLLAQALRAQGELLDRDGSWLPPRENLDYDPDDLADPRANPLGAKPAPAKATRADEETAREPDSGAIQDRLAAKSGAAAPEERAADVPPPDQEAVATKRAAQAAKDQYGDEEAELDKVAPPR